MRPVLPGDILTAARALLSVPREARAKLAARLISEADAADRYRKKYRKAHALFGNGTLMACAMKRPISDQPRSDDPEFIDCQFQIFTALTGRKQSSV